MKEKRLAVIVSLTSILALSMPVKVFATPEVIKSSIDLIDLQEDGFNEIVEQILEVKKNHPDWNEQQIRAYMDEAHGDPSARDGVIDIWNSLTVSEKKLVIRYPFDALKVNKAKV